ncbi:MAG: bifunctional riboflavin kinase/FAD synthetase [Candidatus Omnitrophica bacterium]|nr:bifunctional riboflavin kinase/FAD synthetase [Candidatus Omnitrophota bacterium]
MRIITNLKRLNKTFKNPVVAIGIFDGAHLGHKKILRRAVREAARIKGQSIVVTFNPHPRRVLDMIGAPPLLVSLRHRLNLIGKEGIDVICVLNFNEVFARYDAGEFVKRILVDKIGARTVIVGSNFRFGSNKRGDVKLLKAMGESLNFSVISVPLLRINSRPVSSTAIRNLITRGRLRVAQGLLGRPVSVLGTVVKGTARGRLLGYPTANINPHHEAIPPSGVYAVYAAVGRARYKGILNIGRRPTFENAGLAEPTIEVHLFGFHKDIYGRAIEVFFVKKLRDEKRFPSKELLVKQIRIDEHSADVIL